MIDITTPFGAKQAHAALEITAEKNAYERRVREILGGHGSKLGEIIRIDDNTAVAEVLNAPDGEPRFAICVPQPGFAGRRVFEEYPSLDLALLAVVAFRNGAREGDGSVVFAARALGVPIP